MKAITIKEPWASLIINGYKKYEFRTWKTNYRGKVLIHAGKGKDNINDFDFDYGFGEIIGEAIIRDCIKVDNNLKEKLIKINELVYKNMPNNGYAFVLDNIVKYKKRISCKGKLSLWEYNLK